MLSYENELLGNPYISSYILLSTKYFILLEFKYIESLLCKFSSIYCSLKNGSQMKCISFIPTLSIWYSID